MTRMTTKTTRRSVGSRSRASKGRRRSPGAPSTSTTCGCPGCCTGRSSAARVAHGRIRRIDTSAARAVEGVHSVVTGEDIRSVIPQPYYGPAFHDQPILALDKVRHAGEPVAVVLAADPHVAEEAAQLHRRRLRGAARRVRRGRGDDLEGGRARSAQAGGHVSRSQAPGRPQGHERRARLPPAARRRRARRSRRPITSSSTRFRTQQVLHVPLEPFVSVAEPTGESLTLHTSSQTPVVRAHRDRAAPRLAGEPGAGEGARISAAASARRSTSSSKRS